MCSIFVGIYLIAPVDDDESDETEEVYVGEEPLSLQRKDSLTVGVDIDDIYHLPQVWLQKGKINGPGELGVVQCTILCAHLLIRGEDAYSYT